MTTLTPDASFSPSSGIPAYCAMPSVPSASNHPTPENIAFLFHCWRSACPFDLATARSGFALCMAGSPRRLAESSFSSCGRHIRFPLLSTSVFTDAVTFHYRPVSEPVGGGLPPPW